ncbi:MAG: GWxTD domain-containing protein [Chitinophagales bacterium]|nr:GWxTD domain-containing protein [Chitinophagales bacterium]
MFSRFIIFHFVFLLGATQPIWALEAAMANKAFQVPGLGAYVETNLLVVGNSVKYVVQPSGKYQGEVEVTVLFKNGEAIANYDKYRLKTVELTDSINLSTGIIDLKRYKIPNGNYSIELNLIDLNSKETKQLTQTLSVDFSSDSLQLSDIALIDNYVQANEQGLPMDGSNIDKQYLKGNLFMTPYVIPFYPDNQNKLAFYTELYCPKDSNDQLLASYSIQKANKQVVGSYKVMKKISAGQVVPLFAEFDIANLSSGNYTLVVEIKDKTNQQLAQKTLFFQRSKPAPTPEQDISQMVTTGSFVEKMDLMTMKYQLKTILPIASIQENQLAKKLIKAEDLETMKKFYLHFWLAKDSLQPQKAWETYQAEVKIANEEFGTTINYGFETDRGRVYLQYGRPNQLRDFPRDAGSYPYQIWEYYNIPRQSQVKFVFYNRDLATNEYELIHSTALNEMRNEQWQKLVQGGNRTLSPTDEGTDMPGQFGRNPTENYGNP